MNALYSFLTALVVKTSYLILFLTCPHGHRKKAEGHVFQQLLLGNMVWCTVCRTSHNSKSFNCPCGLSWQMCPVHFRTYTAKQVKRKAACAQETLSEQRSNSYLLQQGGPGMRPMKLGPRLAQRFPSIAQTYYTQCLPRQNFDTATANSTPSNRKSG